MYMRKPSVSKAVIRLFLHLLAFVREKRLCPLKIGTVKESLFIFHQLRCDRTHSL